MELTDAQLWNIVHGDAVGWSKEKDTERIAEQSRWITTFAAVFSHESSGAHIEVFWDRPSTEMQEGSECEISYAEVEQREVTELRWLPATH